MRYLPKTQLEHGQYYEGVNDNDTMVAKWDGDINYFVAVTHTWHGKDQLTMTHPDEPNDYFGVFYPIEIGEPKHYEIVK